MITERDRQLYPALNTGEWEDMGDWGYDSVRFRQLIARLEDQHNVYIGIVITPNSYHYCWSLNIWDSHRDAGYVGKPAFDEAKQIAIAKAEESFNEVKKGWQHIDSLNKP